MTDRNRNFLPKQRSRLGIQNERTKGKTKSLHRICIAALEVFGTIQRRLITPGIASCTIAASFGPEAAANGRQEEMMNVILTRASNTDHTARPAEAAGRAYTLAALGNLISAWRERSYFRWELARLANDAPELIDDIGLTMQQIEAEIAKPFWRR
ncbi:DUF1127 domain-containing protein [Mesorhizobium sp.]|uniref:DUF1127 domain-containing protein n=1 Tax=Mesorhizobium sp. TaxID=1871066 RepID=UPI0025DE8AE7|nr:DUF1127 domain-containing protein [Mesorhizobium sp.]